MTTKTTAAIDYAQTESAIGLNWYEIDPNLSKLMDRYVSPADRDWAEGILRRWGELCGGPIAERAEIIDKNPPRLERYDRWGDEIASIVHHPAAIDQKRDIWNEGPTGVAARDGRDIPTVLGSAFTYLLSQSDTGMVCSTGMTGGVEALVDRYAPPDVREKILPRLQSPTYDGSWDGAMFMTEIRGGSDLAASETTAKQVNGKWVLNGAKWFCSNVDARAIATLARPEGADDGLRGLALFLVPSERSDGTRNGIHIKRLKDKLGTRSVPTAEIELVDAEAYIMSNPNAAESQTRGLNRMMAMVNGSRMGVATMGLGIMRRSFLESAIYAAHRMAFGKRLDELPMVRETLVNMVVAVEAVSAIVFEAASLASSKGDEEGRRLYRILVPLTKFKGARGGLELATQAVEIYGGNGYIETFPTARQLRDAQCHTIWEGTENIICLDVLRAIGKESAHDALLNRVDAALSPVSHSSLSAMKDAVAQARREAQEIIAFVARAEDDVRQLNSRRVTTALSDLVQAALLLEAAQGELDASGDARKAAVARFFIRERLGGAGALRGISDDRSVLDLFDSITRYQPLEPAQLPTAV
ncbi:MAG: acyl-CoA dehydrogenase [Chloroflexi bacterium]|nr:acyl-CoA dehydrogenase [Chloroflexota bacterium]MCI0818224.1 acyl-CoA dehydrogenase [Chloroflexota bacterium]MCI0819307.1 acyl-CoA dehydrogenase [Chloroflexota bacterium]MCI0833055.1 acyl-CoA dehydrogenase [Chloroflexota bacterium]MCI0882919.1 acyl-CoA dehydrogenase [Chloroflexota bacterium]